MFARFLGSFLIRKLIRNRQDAGRRNRSGYGRGGRSASRGGRQSRGGFGMFGPIPTYSTRTRGGSRVQVGGCCLPLALGLFATPATAATLLWRRR